ncbi:MAG: M15 family metallopeptidase [Candidatus Methylumidiphilus sp.]
MLTSAQCLKKYGDPSHENNMIVWDVPATIEKGKIPKRLYCNKDLVGPLEQAFNNIISRGLIDQLESWDGCFNIRKKRGGTSSSLHSWGVAVDVNAASNQFGHKPILSADFVACFEDAGFDWGGRWNKPDGMHFQLKILPA